MKIKVASTGSTGNCYQMIAGDESILLDCGISHHRIYKAFGGLKGIQGCLVTHEHKDHSLAMADLALHGVDIYATAGTYGALHMKPDQSSRYHTVCFKTQYQMGGFTVMPVPVMHDADEPCGFLIRHGLNGEVALYATDTYYLPNRYPGVHFWIIECNFIEERADEMVREGTVSPFMKMRLIRSHMSLRRLKDTLMANDLTMARKIVLVHLSDSRSDEVRMVHEIADLTGIETVAALGGMEIPLDLAPF